MTKLDKVHFGDAAEAETIRKMIIAMAQDPRVLVIKLADRLHNMRTMRFLPPEKQARKARETLEVLAPLAHRLGMATVKWELEDLAFAILHSKRYDEIVRLVADRAPSRDTYLAAVTEQLTAELTAAKIPAEVVGRGKHYYSIYQKMQVRGREFDEIHDLVAVRILVGTVRECYAAMGVVHAMWAPMPGRFKDYIAQPRYGVYQSLAHHRDRTGGQAAGGADPHLRDAPHRRVRHRRRTGATRRPRAPTPAPVPRSTRWPGCGSFSTGSGRPATPASSWTTCATRWRPTTSSCSPRRATSTRSRRVPLRSTSPTRCTPRSATDASGPRWTAGWSRWSSKLVNGNIVEIFTSKAPTAGPSRDWLSFVASSRAKTKIRQYFAKPTP